MVRLDLGCGSNKLEDHIGVDSSVDCGADVVHDLTKAPYPFADASVDMIHSAHFFEHLTGDERILFMHECWRILKPEGRMDIITPYWTSMRAIQDPTHKWPPLCEMSYCYFSKSWRDANKIEHYGIRCNFDFHFSYILDGEVVKMEEEQKQFAFKHYTNAVLDLHVTLFKKAA